MCVCGGLVGGGDSVCAVNERVYEVCICLSKTRVCVNCVKQAE